MRHPGAAGSGAGSGASSPERPPAPPRPPAPRAAGVSAPGRRRRRGGRPASSGSGEVRGHVAVGSLRFPRRAVVPRVTAASRLLSPLKSSGTSCRTSLLVACLSCGGCSACLGSPGRAVPPARSRETPHGAVMRGAALRGGRFVLPLFPKPRPHTLCKRGQEQVLRWRLFLDKFGKTTEEASLRPVTSVASHLQLRRFRVLFKRFLGVA